MSLSRVRLRRLEVGSSVTKTKGAFSSDVALQKLVYLTIQNLHINRAGGPMGDDDL